MPAPINLQHLNVKLVLKDPEALNLELLIPVFHSWIEGQVCEDLLLDVADYRHVPGGPGVVLIGHQADYSVDNTDNRLGVRYNRKAALEGSNQDRLEQATRAALSACQRLESDDRLDGTVRFGGQEMEIFVNDRLLAPNCDATRKAAQQDCQDFAAKLFRGTECTLSYPTDDPRKLFSVSIKTLSSFLTADLLQNLAM